MRRSPPRCAIPRTPTSSQPAIAPSSETAPSDPAMSERVSVAPPPTWDEPKLGQVQLQQKQLPKPSMVLPSAMRYCTAERSFEDTHLSRVWEACASPFGDNGQIAQTYQCVPLSVGRLVIASPVLTVRLVRDQIVTN